MADLFKAIVGNQNWSGTRVEFVELISSIERVDPKLRMLESRKKPKVELPINSRRIQWFSSKNIIPKPNGKHYEYVHLIYYWLAIHLRKKGVIFSQLENLIEEVDFEQAIVTLDPTNEKTNFLKMPGHPSSKLTTEVVAKRLQRMGRKEGRALKSTLIRLAITPWCHVTINEKHIPSLTSEEADILADAFRQSLSNLMVEG